MNHRGDPSMQRNRIFWTSFAILTVLFVVAGMAQHKPDQAPTQIKLSAPAAIPSDQPNASDMAATMVAMGDHHEGGNEGPGHHHEMGPHMKMSALRAVQTGDAEKANSIVATARETLVKYEDSKAAEADGYKIFMPQMKHQKQYHFTNWKYAMEAAFSFNAAHPTSLLYEKVGGDDSSKFRLIGAMYTAPARFTEAQLDQRIPLSVAQWHQHVNLCMPPKGEEKEAIPQPGKSVRFGLAGSISN